MCENLRYFPNPYQDFKRSTENATQSSIVLTDFWNQYALDTGFMCMSKLKPKPYYSDGTLYTGNLGVIFMAYKMLTSKIFSNYENEIKKYMSDCLSANEEYFSYKSSNQTKEVSFLLAKGGLYVMGCLVSKTLGNDSDVAKYAQKYASLVSICEPVNFLPNGSDEMFVGRAGFLCGHLVLKKYLNLQVLNQSEISRICNSIVQSGRSYSAKNRSPCPLMYAYHGSEYLGSAHGLAGILQILLSFPDYLKENSEAEKYVRQSVDFMLSIKKSTGNFPSSINQENPSVPRNESKDLIHWCHGAGGVIFMLAKAYLYFGDQNYLNACIQCDDLIWEKGLLKKGPSVCHGVGGGGCAHLLIYRLTKDVKYLYRANKFAEFLNTETFKAGARTPDNPFSLFEGLAGTVCFVLDLLNPKNAEYPLVPLF